MSDATSGRPVAIVTGAGRRIGKTVAQTLSAKGYRVVVHVHTSLAKGQQTADEINAAGGEAIVHQADLRQESEVRELVTQVREQFGHIEALVNCAAIWKPCRLEEITADQVRAHFEANALSTFLACQHVGLAMVSQPGGGAIVNFGDWAVVRPYMDYAAYFPSKGAIPTLTRDMALELGTRNPRVRVNAVLPGPILLSPDLPPAERQAIVDGTLVKREGRAENMAHAVVFLLENDFVTGVCLPVDGGRSIYAGTS
jgi:pteridine reductase